MQQTLDLIRVSLEAAADPAHRDGAIRYFKEAVHPLGVRSAEMNKIIASAWRRVSSWDKDEILELCERLWDAGSLEEGSLACKLALKLGKRLEETDFARFEDWMNTRVANWAHCDDLGTHAVGTLLMAFPALFPRLAAWTVSENRWVRRGSMVSLVYPLRRNILPMEDAVRLAEPLLSDPDDLVQKGMGWMLKEGTRHHALEVVQFLLAHKEQMSRIALRTAIEKLPETLRQIALSP